MPDTLIKMKTGTISKLEQGTSVVPIDPGSVYFAVDTTAHKGRIVYDVDSSNRIVMSTDAERADHASHATAADEATVLANARAIDGVEFDGSAAIIHYGTCGTAAATAAKTVTLTGFTLVTGAIAHVKFTNTNTAATPTLNINSTGGKNIYDMNGNQVKINGNNYTSTLLANHVYTFLYDGTNYLIINSPRVIEQYEIRTSTTSLNKSAGYGGAGSTFHLICSGSTTEGKPTVTSTGSTSDANVLQMNWDNTGGYDSQIAVGTSGDNMWFRKVGGTWNEVATKADVNGIVAAADAMVFKGTLAGAATTTYTPAANRGDTYKVSTAGLINGITVEVGDILICTTDSTAAATSSNYTTVRNNWAIVQNNVDGAVFKSTNTFTDGQVLVADGTNGKIKTSGYTIAKSVPSDALFTDTIYTHPTTEGNKHIPSGGSSGQFLGWDSAGTAKWVANPNTDTKVNVTSAPTAITQDYILMTSTAPTSTATGNTALASTRMWVNAVDKGKFELVLGNATATSTSGGQFGQLALYSGGTKGTYLTAADNSTAWYTATLPAKTGTIAFTSDIVDTKVNVVARGTTKAYLLADTTAPTSTAAAHTAVAETAVYLDTTAGKLVATSFAGNGSALTSLNASNLGSGTVPIARIPTGTTNVTVALGNHTHNYAGSTSAGGAATDVTTTVDTTNALYVVGVTSDATTTLKRDTGIIVQNNDIYPSVHNEGVVGTPDKAFQSIISAHQMYITGHNTNSGYVLKDGAAQVFGVRPSTIGTTSVEGVAVLSLGNNIATGTANNSTGKLRLYGSDAQYGDIIYNGSTQSIDFIFA